MMMLCCTCRTTISRLSCSRGSRLLRIMLARRLLMIIVIIGVMSWSAQRTSGPPHDGPPAAEVTGPLPLAAVGGDMAQAAIDEVTAAWWAAIEEAEDARRAAETASMAPVGPHAGAGVAAPRDHAGCTLDGWTIPDHVLWRESRCQLDAFNATGCGGRGCVGAAQLDLGHFAVDSPWGGPGGCADLDPGSVADQQECVRRLSRDGTNLAPWGG